jgi:hypothetical protein
MHIAVDLKRIVEFVRDTCAIHEYHKTGLHNDSWMFKLKVIFNVFLLLA